MGSQSVTATSTPERTCRYPLRDPAASAVNVVLQDRSERTITFAWGFSHIILTPTHRRFMKTEIPIRRAYQRGHSWHGDECHLGHLCVSTRCHTLNSRWRRPTWYTLKIWEVLGPNAQCAPGFLTPNNACNSRSIYHRGTRPSLAICFFLLRVW